MDIKIRRRTVIDQLVCRKGTWTAN